MKEVNEIRRLAGLPIKEDINELVKVFRKYASPENTYTLSVGTTLFHGTDRDSFNPREDNLYEPAWLTVNPRTALDYARYQRSGEMGQPRILEYKTVNPLNLLDVTRAPLSDLIDELLGSYISDEIADAVCAIGYDGWFIEDEEIMVCNSDAIAFVGEERMSPSAAMAVLEQESQLPSMRNIEQLRPRLATAAQKVYDAWEQDDEGWCEELGTGGICQDIADAIAGVLVDNGVEAATISATVGEQHVWTIAKTEEGVVEVDISPCTYEVGSCYTWKKIAGVQFYPEDIIIGVISGDPSEFEQYTEAY